MKILSIAYWNPEQVKLYNNGNLSHDIHDSRAEAQEVCNMLKFSGFGGNGYTFPDKTEVKEMTDEEYDSWKEVY